MFKLYTSLSYPAKNWKYSLFFYTSVLSPVSSKQISFLVSIVQVEWSEILLNIWTHLKRKLNCLSNSCCWKCTRTCCMFSFAGISCVRTDEWAPRCPRPSCSDRSHRRRVLQRSGGTGCAALYWQHFPLHTGWIRGTRKGSHYMS